MRGSVFADWFRFYRSLGCGSDEARRLARASMAMQRPRFAGKPAF